MTSTVSVVVITRDRPDEAAATVTCLRALPERPPVVVVVNGGPVPPLADGGVDVLVLGENRAPPAATWACTAAPRPTWPSATTTRGGRRVRWPGPPPCWRPILTRALETRGVIERAKGLLMAREGCTDAEAFDLLRRASQRENVKLHQVAARIVSGQVPAEG